MTVIDDPSSRQSGPDRLADELIRRIFVGAYAPGQHLPPDRQLAEMMGTDRTSLRIALAQLKRMNLLHVVQGSGTIVNDFRTHAGIDFLLHAFRLDDTPSEPSLVRQMHEYFRLTMPGAWSLAAARATPAQFDAIEATYRRQAEEAHDLEACVECALQGVDQVAEASGNVLFPLIFRSTRPLRARLLRHLFLDVDRRARALANVAWVRDVRSGAVPQGDVERAFRNGMRRMYTEAHAALKRLDRDQDPSPTPVTRSPAPLLAITTEERRDVSPDLLADQLIRRIYLGVYAPGTRLPPERDLAPQMGTNRTSLRMALAQIKRMNLISAVQGSGMVVKDWRQHAGIDFLEHACRLAEEAPPGVDLLHDLVDYLNVTVPAIIGAAVRRNVLAGADEVERLCRRALEAADDPDAYADVTVRLQDLTAAATGNLIVALVYRSTRPLRRRETRQVASSTDMRLRVRAYLDLMARLREGHVDADFVEESFRALQKRMYVDALAAREAALRGQPGSSAA